MTEISTIELADSLLETAGVLRLRGIKRDYHANKFLKIAANIEELARKERKTASDRKAAEEIMDQLTRLRNF
jgi:hypothetical protein